MKILHVTPYYPPDRIGGVGEIVRHLHEGLVARGHDSKVLTAGTSADDPRVHRIGKSALGFVLTVWRGLHLSRDRDVVHFQHGEALLLLLLMWVFRVRAKVVVTLHVESWKNGKSYAPPFSVTDGRVLRSLRAAGRFLNTAAHVLVDRAAAHMADQVCFASESVARDFLGWDPPTSPTVIYDGLPPLPEELRDLPGRGDDLLYVGLLSTRKRTDLLPAILHEARNRRSDTILRIVGSDPGDAPALVKSFDQLGLSAAVVWEGPMRSEEIRPIYLRAGVLLIPSVYEGLPTVILEAQQCGLPCVATRVCGHPEVIEDGVNGFLVSVDSPEEMAARAVEILDDEVLRDRMGDAARKVVAERFGVERVVSEHEALYRKVLP